MGVKRYKEGEAVHIGVWKLVGAATVLPPLPWTGKIVNKIGPAVYFVKRDADGETVTVEARYLSRQPKEEGKT